MNSGGTYVVEDLHCSYLPRWGGGIDRGDTSMEFLKLLADFVNQPYWQREREPLALLAPFFPGGARPDLTSFRDIVSVTFYDSMCVVEKRGRKGPSMGWASAWSSARKRPCRPIRWRTEHAELVTGPGAPSAHRHAKYNGECGAAASSCRRATAFPIEFDIGGAE